MSQLTISAIPPLANYFTLVQMNQVILGLIALRRIASGCFHYFLGTYQKQLSIRKSAIRRIGLAGFRPV